jgi:putative transcriptional regulator
VTARQGYNYFIFHTFTHMQGQLLIAHPLLHDGFFNRSVVYLTNHSHEGAVGFSLNFETQYLLRDVRPQIKNGNFPIYEGGPVAKDQLFFLHTLGHDISDSYHVRNNVFLGGNFEELLFKIEHNTIKSYEVKFFAGYSGWEPGQLETEIKSSHWLVNTPVDADFFRNATEGLWGEQLSLVKSSYGIFAEFGSDPMMN